MMGARTDPSRIQIWPVDARDDKGMEFGGKKFPVMLPLIFAKGILDKKNPSPTKEEATRTPEL
jgi:hypothetical protein